MINSFSAIQNFGNELIEVLEQEREEEATGEEAAEESVGEL
jgi:hypothetical protein